MKYLLQGMECPERLSVLISLTDIRSDNIISALEDHYVRGHSAALASKMNGTDHGNVSKAQASLERIATKIERIKELDWQRYGYKSHCQVCHSTDNREVA